MKKEQKALLYNILRTETQLFYLACKDHWNSADWAKDAELNKQYNTLEKEYTAEYGDLPKLQYHEDVVELMENLKKDLGL